MKYVQIPKRSRNAIERTLIGLERLYGEAEVRCVCNRYFELKRKQKNARTQTKKLEREMESLKSKLK